MGSKCMYGAGQSRHLCCWSTPTSLVVASFIQSEAPLRCPHGNSLPGLPGIGQANFMNSKHYMQGNSDGTPVRIALIDQLTTWDEHLQCRRARSLGVPAPRVT